MASNNGSGEPSTAPQPNKWYNITLGASIIDNHRNSPKYCTLRYEFKPASIDNSQPGSLHKTDDNRVTVEFQNNQPGKPKVRFEGVSEDYKDNDAVLFFDGETFRLERLHHAVKRLRHVRLPGETAAPPSAAPVSESCPSPATKGSQNQPSTANVAQPVQVEHFDLNNSDNLDSEMEKQEDHHLSHAEPPAIPQNIGGCDTEEIVNIDGDDDNEDVSGTAEARNVSTKELRTGGLDIDINLPHPADTDDEEIADVDMNDDLADKGLNAAEALRAQVNAEARERQQTSSSSSGSESESSGSGSDSDSGSETTSSGSQSSESGSRTASECGTAS